MFSGEISLNLPLPISLPYSSGYPPNIGDNTFVGNLLASRRVTFNLEAMLGGPGTRGEDPNIHFRILESPLRFKVIMKAMLTVVL